MYCYWLCVVFSDILQLTFRASKDPLWWWIAISLREHWLNHQLGKSLTDCFKWHIKYTIKNHFHMLWSEKLRAVCNSHGVGTQGSTALQCFLGFLCRTRLLLFAASEHRGLCEDEFHSQHLEACLMIIKTKMNYSLKWGTLWFRSHAPLTCIRMALWHAVQSQRRPRLNPLKFNLVLF